MGGGGVKTVVMPVNDRTREKIDGRLADGVDHPVTGEALYTRGEGAQNTHAKAIASTLIGIFHSLA